MSNGWWNLICFQAVISHRVRCLQSFTPPSHPLLQHGGFVQTGSSWRRRWAEETRNPQTLIDALTRPRFPESNFQNGVILGKGLMKCFQRRNASKCRARVEREWNNCWTAMSSVLKNVLWHSVSASTHQLAWIKQLPSPFHLRQGGCVIPGVFSVSVCSICDGNSTKPGACAVAVEGFNKQHKQTQQNSDFFFF